LIEDKKSEELANITEKESYKDLEGKYSPKKSNKSEKRTSVKTESKNLDVLVEQTMEKGIELIKEA